jgi:hypothetical protein
MHAAHISRNERAAGKVRILGILENLLPGAVDEARSTRGTIYHLLC